MVLMIASASSQTSSNMHSAVLHVAEYRMYALQILADVQSYLREKDWRTTLLDMKLFVADLSQRWLSDDDVLIFGFVVFLVCATAALLCGLNTRDSGSDTSRTVKKDELLALEALSSILVPTAYAHPKHYQRYLPHTSIETQARYFWKGSKYAAPKVTLILDFARLWRNLALGFVELKDGSVLEDLCAGEVVVYGCAVRMRFGHGWIAGAVWELFLAKLEFWQEGWGRCLETRCGARSKADGNGHAAAIPNLSKSSNSFSRPSHEIHIH